MSCSLEELAAALKDAEEHFEHGAELGAELDAARVEVAAAQV